MDHSRLMENSGNLAKLMFAMDMISMVTMVMLQLFSIHTQSVVGVQEIVQQFLKAVHLTLESAQVHHSY